MNIEIKINLALSLQCNYKASETNVGLVEVFM